MSCLFTQRVLNYFLHNVHLKFGYTHMNLNFTKTKGGRRNLTML